jgi:hypothetical protein
MSGLEAEKKVMDDRKINVTIIVDKYNTDETVARDVVAIITVDKQVADQCILLKTTAEALYDTSIVTDYELHTSFPFHIENDIKYILNAVFSHLKHHSKNGYKPIHKPLPSHDFARSGADLLDIEFIEGNAHAYEQQPALPAAATGNTPPAAAATGNAPRAPKPRVAATGDTPPAAAPDADEEELRKEELRKYNYLMDIAFVARRLDIPPLLELAGAKIASMIKYEVSQSPTLGGQADRLRRRFGIEDKFPKNDPERSRAMKEAQQEFKSPQKPAAASAAAALPAASREVPIVADTRNYVADDQKLQGMTQKQLEDLNVQTAMNSAAAAPRVVAPPPAAPRPAAAAAVTRGPSTDAAWGPNETGQKGGRKARK